MTNTGGGNVSVIDTATNAVTATITIADNTQGLAITPSGSTLYIGEWTNTRVWVADTATNTAPAGSAITPGSQPNFLAVSPDGTRLYVANYLSNTVSQINTATNLVITYASSAYSYAVAVSADNATVYVTSINGNYIDRFDAATMTFNGRILTNGAPNALTVSPDGKTLYIAQRGANQILISAL